MDILTRIITLPLFAIAIYFAVYLPGQFLCHFIYPRFSFAPRLLVSFIAGILLLTVAYMVLGFAAPEFVAPYLLLIIGIFLFVRKGRRFMSFTTLGKLFVTKKLLVLLFLLGILTTGWFMFRGGILLKEGVFNAGPSYHDSLWHLSLIAELKHAFPPQVPTIAGEPLKNYHYFSDTTTAALSFLLPYDIRHLYFFHMPVLIIMLMVLSIYVVTKKIITDEIAAYVALGLTFFCGSFAYVLPLIFGSDFPWQESSFWVSQTVSMAQNPPFMFSVPILLTALFLISEYAQIKRPTLLFSGGIILGLLVGFKVYAFTIGIIGFSALLVWQFIRYRFQAIWYFTSFTVTIFVALLFMQLLKGPTTGSIFIFAPFWYMRALVEHSERMPFMDWVLREDTYRAEHNWLRVAQLRIQELAIFVVGNLGVRIIGIFAAKRILEALRKNETIVILLLFSLIPSFCLPLLFVQAGVVSATIQFWFYTLIIMNIFAGVAVALLFRNKSQTVKVSVLSLLFILAIPTTLQNMYINLHGSIALNRREYDALRFVKDHASKDAVILVKPDSEQEDKAYVSAFSERRTYFSYNQIAEITRVNTQARREFGKDIFTATDSAASLAKLRSQNISYIYDLDNSPSIHRLGLPLFYSNSPVQIYSVLK